MDLKTYLSTTRTTQVQLAEKLGVTQPLIWQWLNGVRPIPTDRMPDIERVSGGLCGRRDLHPEWQRIWPELSP